MHDVATSDDDEVAVDRRVWAIVEAEGFDGPRYDQLLNWLAGHAIRTVGGAIASGDMFRRCSRQLRTTVLYRPHSWTSADIEEMTIGTVAEGLRRFSELARKGAGWSPEMGRTLAAYLFGLCVGDFPNVFRSWRRFNQRSQGRIVRPFEIDLPARSDLRDQVDVSVDFALATSRLPDDQRAAIRLLARGMTHQEIAHELGRSPRSVEGLIVRARRALMVTYRGD